MSAVLKQPTLSLRPMNLSDLPAIMAIEHRAYEYPWTEGIFLDCLRVGYCCWVCVNGQEIVGYAVMSAGGGEAHVLNICVSPEYRHQGLGHRLLDHMLNLAQQYNSDTVLLEVRASNLAAIGLYRSMGFNEIGMRMGYYPAPNGKEDAVILARSLMI
ncbi:MAG: ribosomal protein S18-alanine N-acetyltransferase [Gammaproteobacteria bacterium]